MKTSGRCTLVIRTILIAAAFATLAFRFPFDTRPAPLSMPLVPEMRQGEAEVRSLAAAWPDRIAEIALRDGDWMLRIDGTWFAWTHGRLMPEAERGEWQDFAPLAFYDYPRGLPALPSFDAEAAGRLRARVAAGQKHPPRRNETFLGLLLHAPNRAATESRLVRTEISGFSVTVHERLRAPLERVSRELDSLKRADPRVSAYMRQLAEMNGYNYRFVEGTRSRSLHSYGTAIDLIPKRAFGHSYWLWAMGTVPDWWTIPYEDRWMPPLTVVRAFERQGFVWGGKWLFFDTMHFEYRPEIVLMRSSTGLREQEEL
jgi:hypothetical protein